MSSGKSDQGLAPAGTIPSTLSLIGPGDPTGDPTEDPSDGPSVAVAAGHGGSRQPVGWARPWLVAGGVAAATAAVDVLDPAHRHVPLCPFHAFTGLWCPLCGGLRATQALAHGHVATALHDNVIFVASIPLLLWFWLDWVGRARAGRPPRTVGRAANVAIIAVLVVFTIVRNLPGAQALRP